MITSVCLRACCLFSLFFLAGCNVLSRKAYGDSEQFIEDEDFLDALEEELIEPKQNKEEITSACEKAKACGVICVPYEIESIQVIDSKNLWVINYEVRGKTLDIIDLLKDLYLNDGWELSDVIHEGERYTMMIARPDKSLFISLCENKKKSNLISLHCVLGVK